MTLIQNLLLLTGGIVENLSLRTATSLVEREYRHQICVATLALVGTAVAGSVAAGLISAVTSFDKGLVAVSIRHSVPRQRAVSLECRIHESQLLWWAGD